MIGFSKCCLAAMLAMLSYMACGAISRDTARSTTLSECCALAEEHFPLVRQYDLTTRSLAFSLENAARGYWPQLSISGQASYQSEVTKLPIQIPGQQMPELSKDQYRIAADLSQSIYDNGVTRHQKEILKNTAETELQRSTIELYKLHERVTQLYFGVLVIDAQLAQSRLFISDIRAGLDKVKAAVAEGTALKSNANILRVQLLQSGQQEISLRYTRHAYTEMLSLLTGVTISDSTLLALPEMPAFEADNVRPELRLYDLQKQGLAAQQKLIDARSLPRLNLFLQGGAGRPGLNFLDNDFRPYYIGGLRLNWNIGSYYTLHRDKAVLGIAMEAVDVQREVFLLNSGLGSSQFDAEIAKDRELLMSDESIVDLRHNISVAALAQLQSGVITGSDYLREVNNEDRARQEMALHKLQLLLAAYNYQTATGH